MRAARVTLCRVDVFTVGPESEGRKEKQRRGVNQLSTEPVGQRRSKMIRNTVEGAMREHAPLSGRDRTGCHRTSSAPSASAGRGYGSTPTGRTGALRAHGPHTEVGLSVPRRSARPARAARVPTSPSAGGPGTAELGAVDACHRPRPRRRGLSFGHQGGGVATARSRLPLSGLLPNPASRLRCVGSSRERQAKRLGCSAHGNTGSRERDRARQHRADPVVRLRRRR